MKYTSCTPGTAARHFRAHLPRSPAGGHPLSDINNQPAKSVFMTCLPLLTTAGPAPHPPAAASRVQAKVSRQPIRS